VRAIDSGTASAAIAMLGFAVQRRLERGTTDEEVEMLIARFKENAGLLFTVDTLEFLQRGGRIGRAAKFAGQLLHVKPILTIENGEVIPLKRVRGAAKAFAEFQQQFTDSTIDTEHLRVGIAHADAPERAEQLRKMVAGERPKAQVEIVTTLGAVVGTHAGPGTIGFFWFTDDV
jgi:DegV family protein with EDD domain